MADLVIAEIPYEDGNIQYRYARYLSPDGRRWIRHGLFQSYHPNGKLASEGSYVDGKEDGIWTDYHENGQMAARGLYKGGDEVGDWEFWDESGDPTTEL